MSNKYCFNICRNQNWKPSQKLPENMRAWIFQRKNSLLHFSELETFLFLLSRKFPHPGSSSPLLGYYDRCHGGCLLIHYHFDLSISNSIWTHLVLTKLRISNYCFISDTWPFPKYIFYKMIYFMVCYFFKILKLCSFNNPVYSHSHKILPIKYNSWIIKDIMS